MNIFGFSDSNLQYDTMSIWDTTFWIKSPTPYPRNPSSNEAPSVNYNVWYLCEKSTGWMESSPKQLQWTQRKYPGKQPIKGKGWKQGHPTPWRQTGTTQLSHEKNLITFHSTRLVNRDPYNGLLQNPKQLVSIIPHITQPTRVFFIAQLPSKNRSGIWKPTTLLHWGRPWKVSCINIVQDAFCHVWSMKPKIS